MEHLESCRYQNYNERTIVCQLREQIIRKTNKETNKDLEDGFYEFFHTLTGFFRSLFTTLVKDWRDSWSLLSAETTT